MKTSVLEISSTPKETYDEMGRKLIPFYAALHLAETVKVKDGTTRWRLRRFKFPNLFAKLRDYFLERVTEGEEYKTIREGYFGLSKDGLLEARTKPTIDEATECLDISAVISIRQDIDV